MANSDRHVSKDKKILHPNIHRIDDHRFNIDLERFLKSVERLSFQPRLA